MYLPDVPDIYFGDDAVERVYLGDELVWPTDYESKYFTLSIISGGTLNLGRIKNLNYSSNYRGGAVLDYSINDGAWITSVPAGGPWPTSSTPSGITVSAGDTIRFRGDYTGWDWELVPFTPSFFGSTCTFNAYGNINSLIFGDAFLAHTAETVSWAYSHLFEGSPIVSAKHLITPTGIYYDWAFFETFYNCQYLVEPPVIRGKEIYGSLPVFTETFCDCTSLQRIIVPYLDTLRTEAFARWALNVPNTGTFVKKAGVEYPTGAIPSGWTVVEA